MSTQTQFKPATATPQPVSGVLQRKCACGNSTASVDGECEACKQREAFGLQTKLSMGASNDPLEREADRAASHVMRMGSAEGALSRLNTPRLTRRGQAGHAPAGQVPASVHRTLGQQGEPLSSSARAFFEPRFGHDFGRVRVHRDPAAAASAREVSAHAYTVGHHVVFAPGQYAPGTHAGLSLLAHELAHVVQQRAVVQRHAVSPELRSRRGGEGADEIEPEAPAPVLESDEEAHGGRGLIVQRQLAEEFPDSGWAEKNESAEIYAAAAAERECLASTPADPQECDPATPLGWSDFTASPPAGSSFGAETFSGLRERSMNTALLRCRPDAPEAAGAPRRGVQAFFDPAQSWVKPQFSNPTDPAQNACQERIASCQQHFDAMPAGATGTWSLDSTPSPSCPAGAVPRGDVARSRGDCASVIGQDCADRAVAESTRLLAHEQGHYDLSCAMAAKANAMLATTPDFDALLRAAQTTLARQQRLYDRQTDHGCNAGPQSTWETAIAGGLPAVTITIPTPRRGRGRRGR